MTEKIKYDLACHITQFLHGKHKLGIAYKIINMVWDIAYQQGYDDSTNYQAFEKKVEQNEKENN